MNKFLKRELHESTTSSILFKDSIKYNEPHVDPSKS